MAEHESREDRPLPSDGESAPFDDDEISLEPLFRILWSYRRPIWAAVGVAVVLFVLVVLHLLYGRPYEQRANVEFRVLFEGADRGQYPNGLPFSDAEIVTNPVLMQVFQANDLERYLSYERFRAAVFVSEVRNLAVETLSAEYDRRLEGPINTTFVARLEEQFRARRDLLREPLYSLEFLRPAGVELPDALLDKVLNDILAAWAEYAVDHRHAFAYQVDLPGENLIRADLVAADNDVIGLDTLRGRIDRILVSLDELAALPGADLVRVGADGRSLSDVRARLEEVLRSGVRPLLLQALGQGSAADRRVAAGYIEGRLFQAALDKDEAAANVAILEQTLRANTAFNHTFSVPDQENVDQFVDRIIAIALSLERIDRPYQERAMDRIVAAGAVRARAEKELADYREMAALLGGNRSSAGAAAAGNLRAQLARLRDQVAQLLQQARDIHVELSASSLNPAAGVYAVTGPVMIRTARGAVGRAIIMYGLLLTVLTLTLVPLACIVHHTARRVARQSHAARDRPSGSGHSHEPGVGPLGSA